MRGDWGHFGTFEFAIGARSLESAIEHLTHLGIRTLDEPANIDLGDGASWRYVYFQDPDNLYVCVSEVRA
jgi:hypothetical protein